MKKERERDKADKIGRETEWKSKREIKTGHLMQHGERE